MIWSNLVRCFLTGLWSRCSLGIADYCLLSSCLLLESSSINLVTSFPQTQTGLDCSQNDCCINLVDAATKSAPSLRMRLVCAPPKAYTETCMAQSLRQAYDYWYARISALELTHPPLCVCLTLLFPHSRQNEPSQQQAFVGNLSFR